MECSLEFLETLRCFMPECLQYTLPPIFGSEMGLIVQTADASVNPLLIRDLRQASLALQR